LPEDTYRLCCMDRGWDPGEWQAWCLLTLQAALAEPPASVSSLT
jgi:hypothetical protein